MAPKDKKGAKKTPVTTDSRFASVHNDPRFAPVKRDDLKVKVDSRFSKEELGLQNSRAKIDRYGRKLKDQKATKDFDKFYEKSDEESEDSEDSAEEKSEDEAEEKESSSEDEDQATVLDRARGEGINSDDSSSSSDESDSEIEDEYSEESDVVIEEEEPEEGDPTATIAVTNMDWDHLRAVDLLATFSSFVPTTGFIESVTIYPSEFGKERMQKEEVEGPPRELFQSKKSKKVEDSDDDDSDADLDLASAAKKLYEEGDAQDYDSKSLRKYQLQRLRYYYAIVRCDSVATAKAIYDNCDGTEYESTANLFDLRYVPEGMEFEEDDAKDRATKIPANYKPQDFVTDALQHSKVKLTWDETPAERMTLSKKAFSQKEIEDMDFKAYLASDSEESDVEDLKKKYKSLVGGSKDDAFIDNAQGEDDLDMEITFTPGLSEEAAAAAAAEKQEESTIEKIKNKEKERRRQRKQKLKELKKQQEEAKRSAKKERKAGKSDSKPDQVSREELELLMLDENEEDAKKGRSHFNMKEIIKSEKEKKRKRGKKGANAEDEDTNNDDIDIVDSRFSEVFEDHRFAIDPTSSEYKNTPVMKKILKERSKRSLKRSKEDSHKKRKVK